MKLSASKAKWLINLYPPLLFNRIVVTRIKSDFTEVDVKINYSWLNKNLQKTIFGGTLFSAADPFFSLMYWQALVQQGVKAEAWVKRLEIDYIRPANADVFLQFILTQEELTTAKENVEKNGKFDKWHAINIVDKEGRICCKVKIHVYLRKTKPQKHE